jgi:hypothetical protein
LAKGLGFLAWNRKSNSTFSIIKRLGFKAIACSKRESQIGGLLGFYNIKRKREEEKRKSDFRLQQWILSQLLLVVLLLNYPHRISKNS